MAVLRLHALLGLQPRIAALGVGRAEGIGSRASVSTKP